MSGVRKALLSILFGAVFLLTSCVVGYVNQLPVALATANPTSGYAPLTVNFDASGSSDPEGGPLTYGWDFGDGVTGSGVTLSHTYGDDGVYTATLTVTDNVGQADQASVNIAVTNPAPTASFSFSIAGSSTVNFDASGSSDPDGGIVNYDWDFGDGDTGSGVAVSHTYTDSGDFEVTLTVTDDDGASDIAKARVVYDDFTGPDGTAPNPNRWSEWVSYDMSSVTMELNSNRMRTYCVDNIPDDDTIGCGIKTQATFSSFEVQVELHGTNGPGFGYGHFFIFAENADQFFDVFVGTHWNVGGGWYANFSATPGTPGGGYNVCTILGMNLAIPHTFRMVGTPGEKVSWYLDASKACEMTNWMPDTSNPFAVGFSGKPGLSAGEWRETFYDNFLLVYSGS